MFDRTTSLRVPLDSRRHALPDGVNYRPERPRLGVQLEVKNIVAGTSIFSRDIEPMFYAYDFVDRFN